MAAALLESATGARTAIEVGPKCHPSGSVSPVARISAYVPRTAARRPAFRLATMLQAARRRRLLPRVALDRKDIADEEWASGWKQYYKPSLIAPNLYVVPTWERAFKPPRGAAVIRLDPGMAFGTGQHVTTLLAARLLLPHVKPRGTVIDVGCGSGILGLAAAKRGARVYATDEDPIAVHVTRDNFASNNLRPAVVARADGIPASFPRADAIVANITAPVIERLARSLARQLKRGGVLVTSGIIRNKGAAVLRALEREKLELVDTGRLAQIAFESGRPIVAGIWRAYVHRKR